MSHLVACSLSHWAQWRDPTTEMRACLAPRRLLTGGVAPQIAAFFGVAAQPRRRGWISEGALRRVQVGQFISAFVESNTQPGRRDDAAGGGKAVWIPISLISTRDDVVSLRRSDESSCKATNVGAGIAIASELAEVAEWLTLRNMTARPPANRNSSKLRIRPAAQVARLGLTRVRMTAIRRINRSKVLKGGSGKTA